MMVISPDSCKLAITASIVEGMKGCRELQPGIDRTNVENC